VKVVQEGMGKISTLETCALNECCSQETESSLSFRSGFVALWLPVSQPFQAFAMPGCRVLRLNATYKALSTPERHFSHEGTKTRRKRLLIVWKLALGWNRECFLLPLWLRVSIVFRFAFKRETGHCKQCPVRFEMIWLS
jgi:hypothetical protein